MGLLLFNAISSVGGGIALMTDVIPEQVQWIQHNDFPSLYFPGVILMAIVGGSAALAAVAMAKRRRRLGAGKPAVRDDHGLLDHR